MTQYKALLPAKIFSSEVSIVSIPECGKPMTYAFISFFATARKDTVPWLSLSILNKPTPRRKFIAFSRIFASRTTASACLEVITYHDEVRDRNRSHGTHTHLFGVSQGSLMQFFFPFVRGSRGHSGVKERENGLCNCLTT